MADLGELIGAIAAAVAHGRRISDDTTVALAEIYREDAMRAEMSVPRMRIGDVTVEIPVVLQGLEAGETAEIASANRLVAVASEQLKSSIADQGVALPRGILTRFRSNLASGLAAAPGVKEGGAKSRETVARVAMKAVSQTVESISVSGETVDWRRVTQEVGDRARDSALVKDAAPARLQVTMLTQDVKELSTPENVTRIRITIREEGLEWTQVEQPDGTRIGKLIPE